MTYETSYDSGLKPFNHDKDRGKWSSPKDFFFTCLGHAFKIDAIFVLPSFVFRELGIYALVPHFITLGVVVMPIIFMQSFLGQFSSTGFISVFRISPLFKGIGYVSLAINLITLTYYSIFGAIPLFYLLYSVRTSLPWSCEASKDWMKVGENYTSICEKNYTIYSYDSVLVPSIEFFKFHLSPMKYEDEDLPSGSFSWILLFCTFIVWVIVAALVTKPTEFIGKFIRYSCLTLIGLISLCFLRFIFLPGALEGLKQFFHLDKMKYFTVWPIISFIAFSSLGPGWGSILTMASYNDFKTNIFRNTWVLSLAQVGLMLGLSFMCIFMTDFMLHDDLDRFYYQHSETQWMDFLMIPTGLTLIELSHVWSLIFFGILLLGSLNLLIVQLFSVLTSLFDEHEVLRGYRKEVAIGSVGVLALSSIYFCSNHGIVFFESLMRFAIMTQMALNLLLLIIVLWVYGRERFQRDVNFMTSRTYPTWMMNIVRYVAPFFLAIGWLFGLFLFSVGPIGTHETWLMFSIILIINLLPWCFVPGYCVFKIMQTTGILGVRLRRCVRPTDWYPVDPVDRQKYEETFNNSSEISHQLAIDPAEL